MPARHNLAAPAAFLLAALVTFAAGAARAGEDALEPGRLLEWAGAELLPVSVNAGATPSYARSPSRFQAGFGGLLRVLRMRWGNAYWTPLEAGAFVAGGGSGPDLTVLLQLATEGGVRLPVGGGTLELGLGAGAGGLAVGYDSGCDGTCAIGGLGPMLSPVARYLLRDAGRWSFGVVLRAAVPLTVPHEEWLGHIEGFGTLVLGGIDVAFGP